MGTGEYSHGVEAALSLSLSLSVSLSLWIKNSSWLTRICLNSSVKEKSLLKVLWMLGHLCDYTRKDDDMHVLLIHKFQIYGQTFKLNHQNWKNVKPIYWRSRKWTGCYNEKNPIVHSGSTVLKTWYEIPVPAFLCKPCNCIFAGSKILPRLPQFITFCGIPFSAFHAPD